MLEKDFCTPRQAARILGRSPSTISRALAQGRLSYIDPEKKLLLRAGLEQRFANATRRKADCPQKAERDDNAANRLARGMGVAEPQYTVLGIAHGSGSPLNNPRGSLGMLKLTSYHRLHGITLLATPA